MFCRQRDTITLNATKENGSPVEIINIDEEVVPDPPTENLGEFFHNAPPVLPEMEDNPSISDDSRAEEEIVTTDSDGHQISETLDPIVTERSEIDSE